jgi:hypothetical protein
MGGVVKIIFDITAAIFAFGAAYFWLKSAEVILPAPGQYWGHMPETDPWLTATRTSAKLNRLAAICAGISALTSAVSMCIAIFHA